MNNELHDEIRQRYGEVARAVGATGCCGSDCACGDAISSNLYSEAERQQLPADAVAVLTEMPDAHRSLRRRRALQMRTAQIQQLGTLAIGEQAEVANAHKTGGQNMQQEAT